MEKNLKKYLARQQGFFNPTDMIYALNKCIKPIDLENLKIDFRNQHRAPRFRKQGFFPHFSKKKTKNT